MTVSSGALLCAEPEDAERCRCGAEALGDETVAPWLPWKGRGWPATRSEERVFVLDLWDATDGRPTGYRRKDVTVLVNGLRAGLTVGELLDRAPGAAPSRLLGAYLDIQDRRRAAIRAWDEILLVRSAASVLDAGPVAARLLPGLVSQLWSIARSRPAQLPDAVSRIERLCACAAASAAEVERRIDECLDGCPTRARLAGRLLAPDEPTLWSDPAYVPTRVTDLVSERLRTLVHDAT